VDSEARAESHKKKMESVLDDGLQAGKVLAAIALMLPNRSRDAIIRRACQKGYSVHLEPSGDKTFAFGVKSRSRIKKEVSGEDKSLQTKSKSDAVNSKTVNEIVSNDAFGFVVKSRNDRAEIERAMDTLESAGYPVDIYAVAMLVKLKPPI